KLGDIDGAIRVYRRCVELEPGDVRPLGALARLLESRGAWPELVEVLEKELEILAVASQPAERALRAARASTDAPTEPQPDAEMARRISLYQRVGEIRRDRLERSVEAASAFEAVLELEPRNQLALHALEQLYQRLGRDGDLLRVLERKADIASDPVARAEDFG